MLAFFFRLAYKRLVRGGKAIAGAQGNENARIFVHRLEAELISIAGCFQVFENGVPENVRGKPAQIRLDGTRLIFDPLPE